MPGDDKTWRSPKAQIRSAGQLLTIWIIKGKGYFVPFDNLFRGDSCRSWHDRHGSPLSVGAWDVGDPGFGGQISRLDPRLVSWTLKFAAESERIRGFLAGDHQCTSRWRVSL